MIYIYGIEFFLMLSLRHLPDIRVIPIKILLTVIPHPYAVFIHFGIFSSQFNSQITCGKMIRPSFALMRNKNNIWIDFENQCLKFLLFFRIPLTNMAIEKIQFMNM